MATSAPFSFKPQVPVTPPPDQHMFFKGFVPPQLPRSDFTRAAFELAGMKPLQETTPAPSQPSTRSSTQPNTTPAPQTPRGVAGPGGPEMATASNNPLQTPTLDPRYLAMASRITSYYQQRCQAVTNFQQQRCQVWANAQRQKCQEMMQAAMLVVAWYIRDRISRRRRRQRKAFKRGLKRNARVSANSSRNKITKGEAVRRWVLNVPLGTAASPRAETNGETRKLDKEEEAFDMDKDEAVRTSDKDAQLFNVADNLIKSQLTRINVPLLGTLSFDESDDESDSESEFEEEEEEEDFEQAGDEDMEDDDEFYDDDGEYEVDEGQQTTGADVAGSKSVHLSTSTKGSRKRTRSNSCAS